MRRLTASSAASPSFASLIGAVSALGILAVNVVGATRVNAQAFNVLYDFTGTLGSQTTSPATASSVPANLTAADISRGLGLSATAGAGGFNSSAWSQPALDLTDYLTLGVTPSAGFAVSLSSLSYIERRSATGPVNFVIRSSVDNFTGNLFTYSLAAGNTSDTSESFTLSGIASLQNLTSAVAIRLYGFGGTSGAGTYRFNSPSAGTGVVLGGTLAALGSPSGAAPEPGSLALLLPAMGTMGIVGVVLRRRKR